MPATPRRARRERTFGRTSACLSCRISRIIGFHLASMVQKRLAGTYTDVAAKALIDSEEDAIQTLVETMVSLAVLEAQIVVNAIVDALNKAVNTALGFTLLA